MAKQTQTKEQQLKSILSGKVKERAILYARTSGDDSRKDGRNLEGQLEMCREYALNKKEYVILEELSEDDKGASGAEIDLPQLNYIRELAQAGSFDVLIVRELDRLSRNLAKQLIIEEELSKARVRVEYVLAEYDNTPEGRLNKHIRATIAEYEREKIKERLVRGKELAAKRGKVLMSFAPLGYDLADGKLTINPVEAKIVKKIFELYVLECYTTVRISKYLDENGIIRQGKSVSAKKHRKHKIGWTPDAVRVILLNPAYAGTFYYGRKNIPVEVPAIVSKKMFDAAKKQMAQNRRYVGRPSLDYLLSGLITCGNCGYSYTAQCKTVNGKKYPKYGCSCRKAAYRYPDINCKNHFVRTPILDDAIWQKIRPLLVDPERLKNALHAYNTKQEKVNRPILSQIEISQELIAKHQAELDRLVEAYQAGVFSLDDIKDKATRLKGTITKLTAAKNEWEGKLAQISISQEVADSVLELVEKIRPGVIYADDNFGARRLLMQRLGVKVTIVPDGKRVKVLLVCYLGELGNFYMDETIAST